MPARRTKRAREVLKLTLEAPATPDRVRQVATLFQETLCQVEHDLPEGDVTLVVDNYSAKAEVRGWHEGGERAVRLTTELIDNATAAVQENPELAAAARTLANHIAHLLSARPTFWRGRKKLRAVDDVFLRTMRAAGHVEVSTSAGNLRGETIVYSAILRVGRVSEGGRVQARVRLEGRPLDVDIGGDLEEHVWDLAKTGRTARLRLRGEWMDTTDGLRLDKAEIISVDSTFEAWSGSEILGDLSQHASLFSAGDFDDMLAGLQLDMED